MNKGRISLAIALALLIVVAVVINMRPAQAHNCYQGVQPATVCGWEMSVDPLTGNMVSVYVCR